jgi:hypothetical protein
VLVWNLTRIHYCIRKEETKKGDVIPFGGTHGMESVD